VTRRAGLGLTALAAVACAAEAGPPGRAGATPAAAEPPPIFDRGGRLTVYRGVHTVYHSDAPLPTAAAPRGDGKATLVWFSQPT
jgi:hypothetical protein